MFAWQLVPPPVIALTGGQAVVWPKCQFIRLVLLCLALHSEHTVAQLDHMSLRERAVHAARDVLNDVCGSVPQERRDTGVTLSVWPHISFNVPERETLFLLTWHAHWRQACANGKLTSSAVQGCTHVSRCPAFQIKSGPCSPPGICAWTIYSGVQSHGLWW